MQECAAEIIVVAQGHPFVAVPDVERGFLRIALRADEDRGVAAGDVEGYLHYGITRGGDEQNGIALRVCHGGRGG